MAPRLGPRERERERYWREGWREREVEVEIEGRERVERDPVTASRAEDTASRAEYPIKAYA